MLRISAIAALFITLIGSTSCETEFSLNGEYELEPIIFGLLDYKDTIHYVKITKAYLGDGDNLEYAKIADSSYFDQVDAKVIEYLNGDPTGREWALQDTIFYTKDENGIFYAPAQKVYFFVASDLDTKAEYELVADLNNGSLIVDARTSMIDGFSPASNMSLPTYKIYLANNNVTSNDDYSLWPITVTEGLNAAQYNYKYTLKWRDYYFDGSSQDFSATKDERDTYQDHPNDPTSQTIYVSGLEFYQWVAMAVPDKDASIDKRKFLGIDLQISLAHQDLTQYMEVAKPVSGIAQVQPEYTNINGGLGLFSSRIIYTVPNLDISSSSLKHLCEGSITYSKGFCSSLPEHSGELFYCP